MRCYSNSMSTPSPNLGKYTDWIQVYENTFRESATGTSASDGAVVIDSSSGKGSMRVQDNDFIDLDGNGVATYRAGGTGTLTVSYNVFDGLGGSGVQIANYYSGAKTVVTENTMVNGTGSVHSVCVRNVTDR